MLRKQTSPILALLRIAAKSSILALLFASSLTYAGLPQSLKKVLNKHNIPHSSVSALVIDLSNNKPVISLNPDTPRNPASVMKLVTTLAALEILGPSYTWPTQYYLDGELKSGTLHGDLIIKGNGDPYLVLEQFWRHLMSLRERGLKHIIGNLGIDNSRFAEQDHNPAEFDNSPYRLYNVGASATVVNFNATRFGFYPHDGIVNIITDPPMPNIRVVDKLRAATGKCQGKESGWSQNIKTKALSFSNQATSPALEAIVTLSGKYKSRCGNYDLRRSVLPSDDYVFGVFQSTWNNLGGSLSGNKILKQAPANLKPFVVGGSKPLAEVIKGTNKYSNNLMARQLLMTLGLSDDAPATQEKGIAAIQNWLAKEQIDMPALQMENGAGLSRDIKVSAIGLGHLLKHGWDSNYRPEFLTSLSITAIDGTTQKRLRHLHPDGRIRAKTGYLKGTRSIAGYAKAKSGKTYAVILMLNDKKIQYWSGNQIQDTLLTWVLEQ